MFSRRRFIAALGAAAVAGPAIAQAPQVDVYLDPN